MDRRARSDPVWRGRNTKPKGTERTITGTVVDVSCKFGQGLTWKNDDQVDHTVTGNNGAFSSGVIDQGASFARTFSAAGTFDYFCAIHPAMKGSVVVQP